MRFMALPQLKPGYWWENVATLGDRPKWEMRPMPVDDAGKLFGYSEQEFMAKQYRRVA